MSGISFKKSISIRPETIIYKDDEDKGSGARVREPSHDRKIRRANILYPYTGWEYRFFSGFFQDRIRFDAIVFSDQFTGLGDGRLEFPLANKLDLVGRRIAGSARMVF